VAAKDFLQFKNWVVVGDVLNESKYASKIRKELLAYGYRAAGVHPKGGGDVCAKLADVDYTAEVIDLCINPKAGLDYMHEAAKLGIKKVLIQPGAASPEILDYCRDNGIEGVEGCALVLLSLHGKNNQL
jgi:predicted CoA-binding protein